MTNRYLHHVTLTTAHSRRSYRHEVENDTLRVCAELIERAIEDPREHVVIPATDCTMTATAESRALIATVWGPVTEIRNSPPTRPPLVTFGVSDHSRAGSKLWRILHQAREPEVQTSPDNPPPTPWIGARLEIGIALMPEHAEWISDFEWCIGWAWLERDRTFVAGDRATRSRSKGEG